MELMEASTLPYHLDLTWKQVNQEGITDLQLGRAVQSAIEPRSLFSTYMEDHYPQFARIYTDATFNPTTSTGGVTFYDPHNNFRFGLRMSEFHSTDSMELTGIQLAIECAIRNYIQDVAILTDSRRLVETFNWPLLCLRDLSPTVQKISELVEAYSHYKSDKLN